MPPGPLYNWLCVAHAVCDVLSHAAQIRAAQAASVSYATGFSVNDRSRTARPRETLGAEPACVPSAGSLGGKSVHSEKERPSATTVPQASLAAGILGIDITTDEEVVRNEETEYIRRHGAHSVSTTVQPVHPPALQDGLTRSWPRFEEPLAPSAPASAQGVSSAILEQHTSPGPATTTASSSIPQTTFHSPVSHASTSTQRVSASDSVVMMTAEDPSREVLGEALAQEASPVIGTTSEVPAHEVPSITGIPEPAEPSTPVSLPSRHLQSSKVPSSR
ncbi:hypothetical protein FOMPIDRAFT_161122, partial [Fomitopsis schrenkii]